MLELAENVSITVSIFQRKLDLFTIIGNGLLWQQ